MRLQLVRKEIEVCRLARYQNFKIGTLCRLHFDFSNVYYAVPHHAVIVSWLFAPREYVVRATKIVTSPIIVLWKLLMMRLVRVSPVTSLALKPDGGLRR